MPAIKDEPPYFNDNPTHKPPSDTADRMLLGAVILSAIVAIGGFVFVAARLFGSSVTPLVKR